MQRQTPAPAQTFSPAPSCSPAPPPAPYYPNGNLNAGYNPPGVKNTDSAAVAIGPKAPVIHDYACDGPAPGSVSFTWTYGSRIAAKNSDPRVQVVQYNEDSFILRQNVCIHWEAPFIYLLFGNKGALLIDTGATPQAECFPIRKTVDAIVARWCRMRGRADIPLTIAFTSAEDHAQNQGLVQFAGRASTTIVPKPLALLKRFYRLDGTWPEGTGRIDLGGRIIQVIPTPGTHKDGVSFYDPYNRFLHTGDLLFPGRINIGNERDFIASLARLKAYKDTTPVQCVMGGHIDMKFLPGKAYPRFATYKPYQRPLEMEPALIDEALHYAREIAGKQILLIRPDFHLLNGVSPDQRTRVWPEGVPNINVADPF
jgi:glyoxylase-like metal-dependent hydrolase (beta-lactamase superfamily II)